MKFSLGYKHKKSPEPMQTLIRGVLMYPRKGELFPLSNSVIERLNIWGILMYRRFLVLKKPLAVVVRHHRGGYCITCGVCPANGFQEQGSKI
ncbi:MAG: hypothetical protein COA36_17265 [Desulfotalea sp.]|nr:MAG: hypothetical protein COA36_17265 [Desulfotalea sp.]